MPSPLPEKKQPIFEEQTELKTQVSFLGMLKTKLVVVKQWISKVWGFVPLTLAGLALLVLCALGFWYIGVLHKDIILLLTTLALAFTAMLMILVVSIASIVTARYWKTAHIDDAVIRMEAEYPKNTDITLKLPLLPFAEVTWSWLWPPNIHVETDFKWGKVSETATAKHRCLIEGVTREIHISDVLGLARIHWRFKRPTTVITLPWKGSLEHNRIMLSLSGGDDYPDPYGDPQGDRIEMRQYVPGDSSRAIIWKVYARNRKVMVRMPERALTVKPRTCAYMVAGENDEASAGVARIVLENGLLGDNWCFGADGTNGSATSISQSMELLARSGNPDVSTTGLAAFLKQAEIEGYQSCIVFVPATPGKWLDRVHSAVNTSRIAITWFVGIDELSEEPAVKTQLETILYRQEKHSIDNPQAVVEKLTNSSSQVILCQRRTGKIVSNALQFLKSRKAG